jgi:hypothetical protein
MSRIKEYFLEHRYSQLLDYEKELSWQKEYEEYWLATHFETKQLKNAQWHETTLDLRDFEVLIPHRSPALCYLINSETRILIQSSFNEVKYLWKKVLSNPSNP